VLVSERAHPSDVVATIVDLAVRGYMRIEPVARADDELDFLLRRLKPISGDPAIGRSSCSCSASSSTPTGA
jgi:hypothetical protein